jgi:DNA-binding LytR/AlgR family response regulator
MSKILLIAEDSNSVKLNLPANFETMHITPTPDLLAQIQHLAPEFIVISPELFSKLLAEPKEQSDHVIVSKTRTGLKRVAIADIQYFAADHKYVLVHYNGGELLLNESLNNLALKYGNKVLRIHRNTLVNKMWIDELINEDDKHYITIKGTKTRLSVSRRQLPAVRKYIKCGKSE